MMIAKLIIATNFFIEYLLCEALYYIIQILFWIFIQTFRSNREIGHRSPFQIGDTEALDWSDFYRVAELITGRSLI